MANIIQINGKNVKDNTAARMASLAPVEASTTATAAHAVGECFWLGGVLCEATELIAVGDAITVGKNCNAVNINNMAQSDWNQSTTTAKDYIKNKPAIRQQANGGILENGATNASGSNSHAEGDLTTASGICSHAECASTTASGSYSHAEGASTTASMACSHAEGGSTNATGVCSHAEGSTTTASETCSHAEGGGTTASGACSHAEGSYTTASGLNSHAEGSNTTASGSDSHAEGGDTTASGTCSHAEGGSTTASGACSHAEGTKTIANHFSQHVFGMYNIPDDSIQSSDKIGNYVEIVGNGLDDNNHSNARTLDWNGNESLAGSITLGKGTADEVTLSAAQLKQLLALLN